MKSIGGWALEVYIRRTPSRAATSRDAHDLRHHARPTVGSPHGTWELQHPEAARHHRYAALGSKRYFRTSSLPPSSLTMLRRALLATLTLALLPAVATAQTPDEEAVMAPIHRLFDGMRTADTTMMRSAFHEGAALLSVGPDREGTVTVR